MSASESGITIRLRESASAKFLLDLMEKLNDDSVALGEIAVHGPLHRPTVCLTFEDADRLLIDAALKELG